VDLPAELAAFRTANRGVEVRLRYSGSEELVDDVAAGRADIALVVDTGHEPAGVRFRRLSTQEMLVLCHPEHPFAAEDSIPLERLRGEPLVGFQDGWGAQALTRRAFATAGFDYRAAMEVNDVHPLLDLVGYNLGVAVVPASFARKRPEALRAVRLDGAPSWTVAVAVADQPSPAAAAFLAQLDPRAAAESS
jgi:DNA-binding transcriptional LysR family regulator